MEKGNEYIAKRIKWKADKYSLPTEFSFFFNELSSDKISSYKQLLEGRDIGFPVLFFQATNNRWTILGTQKIVWDDGLKVNDLSLENIEIVTSGSLDRHRKLGQSNLKVFKTNDLKKAEMEDLAIYDSDGNLYNLYAWKGSDLFSLWNILLMAIKLNKIE